MARLTVNYFVTLRLSLASCSPAELASVSSHVNCNKPLGAVSLFLAIVENNNESSLGW